jgi:hypothetical protein
MSISLGVAVGTLLAVSAGLAGCGGVGSCASSGGIVDECKQDWTEAECDDWDNQEVNGASWSFSSDTCDDRGFSVRCPDGSYVRSSGDC